MAKHKRAWGPSNPLWRWQHRHSRSKSRSVSHMARKRSYRPRRFHFRRHHYPKKLSIIKTVGAVGSLFAPRQGYTSIGQSLLNLIQGTWRLDENSLRETARNGIAQYTGFDINDGSFGLPTGTLVLIASGIASSVANRFGRNSFEGIPIIGKKLRW